MSCGGPLFGPGPIGACQLLYQALTAIEVGEYSVSHTPAATNKWWAQCSDMQGGLLYPLEQGNGEVVGG